MADRLYKSKTDRMITGVAGGIAEYFDFDPTLVRAAWVILAFVTAGVGVLAYIALAIIVPERTSEAGGVTHDVSGVQDAEGESASATDDSVGSAALGVHVRRRGVFGGVALIVIGAVFLASNLGLFSWFDWGRFWPVILIFLGLWLTFQRIGGLKRNG